MTALVLTLSIDFGSSFTRSSPFGSFKLVCNQPVIPRTNYSKLVQSVCFLLLLCLVASCIPAVSQSISDGHGAPHDPQTDAAFEHFYNMDYDRAIQEFERILEKH